MAGKKIQQEEMERKIYRHKRRVRNQIISYIVVTIFFIGLIIGGIIGVQKVMSIISDKRQAEEQQEQLEELNDTEDAAQIVEAPSEGLEPEPEETDWLEVMVDETISGMTIQDKVAGLFFITPEALTGADPVIQAGDTTKEKLGEQPVGGLIYSSKNIRDEAQIKEMLQNTKSGSKSAIFLGVEEEGGNVSPVAGSGLVENVGKMADIGAAGDAAAAQVAGNTIGNYLAGYGFNVNFAPVADVVTEGNTLIGERAFGSEQGQVSSMVSSFVEGSQSAGVSTCLKYFPGLGEVEGNASEGMISSDKTIENFMEKDFPAYQAGILAGADFVMVSHLSLPNVTGDNTPSSLSGKMVTEILRQQLGFQGIIITDAMNVAAITEYYTADEAAIKALQAGVDMILMPEDYTTAYEGVLGAVQNGSLTEEQINESLRRIFRVKLRGRLE